MSEIIHNVGADSGVPQLVDVCRFPSTRFGVAYTSRLANDQLVTIVDGVAMGVQTNYPDGVGITHPDSDTVIQTDDGRVVENTILQGLPSVQSVEQTDSGVTIVGGAVETKTDHGVTITNTLNSIASVYTLTSTGATVYGKQCS